MAATQAQAAPLAFLLLLSALLLGAGAIDAGGAHPEYGDQAACGLDGSGAADAAPARLRLQEERRGGGWGRILDITHAYVPDMPAFAPGAVTGPLVRLKASMANGSEYNLSELKMECHMGTHVDAPGHINQRNFAAGLDVDTLDLDVLNGTRLEEYDGGRIMDITHAYRPELPAAGPDGLGRVVHLIMSMANGTLFNLSELRMMVHAGTHLDAPGHMVQEHFEAGLDVDKLDLAVLNGPALLVDVPRNTNITAEAMKSLNIPKGVRRVLFRTLNTDRKLMWKKAGDMSYVGFTEDGAQWLVDNTDIKLVGVDYLSVAAFDYLISAHVVFFKKPDIIPVEGLKLDDVEAGAYMLHCLPLRLIGAEGSPVRCILIK